MATMIGSPVRFSAPDREWLSRKEAAAFLSKLGCKVAPGTLAKWAAHGNAGDGPPFSRFRNLPVQYRRADLEEWVSREHERIE